MAIKRDQVQNEAHFSVGLNVILTGSKKMPESEQERLMSVEKVRVLIVDAGDEANVLVDETVEAKLFSTGSVGYGVNVREVAFGQ